MIFTVLVVSILLGATSWLGFFGTQAVRLLRESWDGVIHPERDGSVRPYGAKLLSEELYAMFDDNIPLEQNAPITINQSTPPGGIPSTPLTINNTYGGHAMNLNGGDVNITNGGGITIEGAGGITLDQGDIHVGGPGGITITEDGILQGGVPIGGGGGGTTNVFLGQVVSGTGSTYSVALFANGSASEVTETVTVKILQIDPDETIPPDTWLGAVHRFVTEEGAVYEATVPIWM